MYVPRAFAHREEFFDAIAKVPMPDEVVSVTPSLGADWDGEPAVFIDVVLKDGLSDNAAVELDQRVTFDISVAVQPMNEWGVFRHFSFRPQSHRQRRQEPNLTT